MALPLSHENQKVTNNLPFLKLFFPDLLQGHFYFFKVFWSTLEQKQIKNAPGDGLSLLGKKSFKKGKLFVVFWFYWLRGHAIFFIIFFLQNHFLDQRTDQKYLKNGTGDGF